MSVKETIMGYRVVAYVPIDECLSQEVAEGEARNAAELVRIHVSPHTQIYKNVDVEADVSRSCEYCGSPWSEDSPSYNGGCCHKDEANRR